MKATHPTTRARRPGSWRHPLRLAAALLSALLLAASSRAEPRLQKSPGHLYVCSFNVYKLGSVAAKYDQLEEEGGDAGDLVAQTPERVRNLARVLAVGGFDLVVLQEVTSGERGQWVLADLTRELASAHGLRYKFFLSEHIGQGLMPEAIAFIYDPRSVMPQNLPGTTSLVQNIEIPGRDLVRTKWVAGDFDFTLIAAHLAWGNRPDRSAGDAKIHEILTTPAPSAFSDDPDVIVLGDLNRFGLNYAFFEGVTYSPDSFLAPNVAIFDPAFNKEREVRRAMIAGKGVPGDDPQLLSTTVAKNTAVYDMFLLSPDVDEELPGAGNSATYGLDFGIIHFDEPGGFGHQAGAERLTHDQLKEAYSDHRPLWMRFRTDLGQSDSEGGSGAGSAGGYVATRSGGRFHLRGCPRIRDAELAKEWASREEAAKEYGPCGSCKP